MSSEIKSLEPKEVWEYFYQLTQIPRPSKHEEKIEEFLVNFGKNLGLETIKDEVGNIIIRKPATPGMENRKGVILQGHLDMVPQANSDKNHDFTVDPIDAYIDGEWVRARGTTLGADNGMGVASTMAVLASKNIAHGPIEALFTCDEETGMTGAFGLKPGILKGDILLNLDSEDEGELYVGCAGGMDGSFYFDAKLKEIPTHHVPYKISVTGLKGGHSGLDINLERGNSNKIMFRLLYMALKKYNIRLADIQGGSLRNAIPRESFATILVPDFYDKEIVPAVLKFEKVIKSELATSDPDISIKITHTEMPANVISDGVESRLIKAVYACPNGVIHMSQDVPGLVETSSNLAIVKLQNGKISVHCLLRSSVDSAKEDLANAIGCVFRLADAEAEFTGGYPGWKPNPKSDILKTMQETSKKMTGKLPEVKAVHAGLECGLLGGVYPNLDMISFGPTIRYPHSPDEKVKITSVKEFYTWLTETLKAIPVK
jgi:dipeptidase D